MMVYFIQGVETGRIKIGVTQSLENRLAAFYTNGSERVNLIAVQGAIIGETGGRKQ